MARVSTVRQLVADLHATETLPKPKPLSEGQLAVIAETMRLLTTAGKRLEQAEFYLENCRVQVDVAPFRRLHECLDEAWQGLQPAMSAHIEAVLAQKGGA